MYGIYAKIWGILMGSYGIHVTIYSIHGSYGYLQKKTRNPGALWKFDPDLTLGNLNPAGHRVGMVSKLELIAVPWQGKDLEGANFFEICRYLIYL